jgi:hypothetical protein
LPRGMKTALIQRAACIEQMPSDPVDVVDSSRLEVRTDRLKLELGTQTGEGRRRVSRQVGAQGG